MNPFVAHVCPADPGYSPVVAVDAHGNSVRVVVVVVVDDVRSCQD